MTATRMLREMNFREFALWRVRYAESPWGDARGDARAAQICALLANINRDASKRPEPFDLMDFMLFKADFEKPESSEDEDDEQDIVSEETKAWLYAMAKRTEAGN